MLRRRLGTASALVGLVLGVAVAAAPWVALDSTLRGLADYYVGGVQIDVFASRYGLTVQDVQSASEAAAAVPNVVRVEPSLPFPDSGFSSLGVNLSGTFYPQGGLWISPTFDFALSRLGVTWTAAPAPDGIVLDDSFRGIGVDVGDPVQIEKRIPIRDENLTVVGNETWTSLRTVTGFYNASVESVFGTRYLLFSLADAENARIELNETANPWSAGLFIWVDRGALVDPYDPEGSALRVQREYTLLDGALSPHRFRVSDSWFLGGVSLRGLAPWLDQFASHVRFLRIWFVPFTIPTIVLAVLLSRVGFDIGLSGRRRELAVLRARGVSQRGVRGFLLVETTVISLLAALGGLGLAFLLSRLTLTLPMFAVFRYQEAPFIPAAEIALTPTTVGLAVGLAWLLAWISSRRAVRLTMSKDIVSAFRAYHAEEVSIPHRASRDFLLAAIGITGLLLLLSSGFLGADVVALLALPTAVLGSAAPIILAVGLGRYLTRGTTRAYRALARLFRGLLGDLEALVDKNIARAPRRASNITMIVTFAVAFAVAMTVFSASSDAFLTDEARRLTPSDIVVRVFTSGDQFHLSGWAEVRSIPGVAEVTPLSKTALDYRWAWAFDARTYLRTVPWLEPRHLGGVDPRQLMDALSHGDSVAVNSRFQALTGLVVGDPVTMVLPSRNRQNVTTITLRLAAVVPFLPGSDIGPDTPQAFFDFSALPSGPALDVDASWFLLVALQAGADSAAVVNALGNLFGDRAQVTTFQDALRSDNVNPVRAGTFAYLTTQSQIAILLLVLGIGLLVYSAASGRRNELVTLVARGLPRNRVARLVMAEGWIVALLGILLGTVTGLLAAASVLGVVSTRLPFPMPFVVPWTAILPVLVVTAGVWAASFLGALSIQRMDIARVLKMRGG